jgi:hypothetical protein
MKRRHVHRVCENRHPPQERWMMLENASEIIERRYEAGVVGGPESW